MHCRDKNCRPYTMCESCYAMFEQELVKEKLAMDDDQEEITLDAMVGGDLQEEVIFPPVFSRGAAD